MGFLVGIGGEDAGKSRVDLILSCVDNYEARMVVNQAALEMGQVSQVPQTSRAPKA